MQNEDFYGPTIFTRTPREMIEAGWIVAPRLHVEYAPNDKTEGALVASAYLEHSKHVAYNAKLLVCCNGNSTIDKIVNDLKFIEETQKNNITVFRISSKGGAWIDGVNYTKDRSEFFDKLRAHTGRAIVLHINILTEGIDVPDFSGVMLLRNMELARFMQSVGRSMRKHADDKDLAIADFANWLKKDAWVILVEKENTSEDTDRNTDLKCNLQRMRDAGYLDGVDLRTQVVINYDKGTGKVEIPRTNEPDDTHKSKFSDFFDIVHQFELEEKARIFRQESAVLLSELLA